MSTKKIILDSTPDKVKVPLQVCVVIWEGAVHSIWTRREHASRIVNQLTSGSELTEGSVVTVELDVNPTPHLCTHLSVRDQIQEVMAEITTRATRS